MTDKFILDACCGGKSFWFDKNHPNTIYLDKRNESHKLNYERNKQNIVISPDIVADFTNMPFDDKSFRLVVFDPPHAKFNKNSIMYKKYGTLDDNWKETLRLGFKECFRILEDNGILVFKWAESRIKLSEILELTQYDPLFGHKTTKTNHWVLFIKN